MATTPVRESYIERHLAKRVKELGGLSYKWHSPNMRGVPDRIVLLNKQVWFVELKRPKGHRSRLQAKFEQDVKPFDINYALIDSIEAVNNLIDDIMRG
jgi:hypothetical protein